MPPSTDLILEEKIKLALQHFRGKRIDEASKVYGDNVQGGLDKSRIGVYHSQYAMILRSKSTRRGDLWQEKEADNKIDLCYRKNWQ